MAENIARSGGSGSVSSAHMDQSEPIARPRTIVWLFYGCLASLPMLLYKLPGNVKPVDLVVVILLLSFLPIARDIRMVAPTSLLIPTAILLLAQLRQW